MKTFIPILSIALAFSLAAGLPVAKPGSDFQ